MATIRIRSYASTIRMSTKGRACPSSTRQIKVAERIGMVPSWLPLAAIHPDAERTA